MHKLIMIGLGVAFAAVAARGDLICAGTSTVTRVIAPAPATVNKALTIYVHPDVPNGDDVSVSVDGTCLISTTNKTETGWRWQPLTKGNHALTCTFGTNVLTKTLNVTALDFYTLASPNPPMAKDNNISITPTTRNFSVDGGAGAIVTSGSGTWTAAVSDTWLTLNAASGNVGYPVAYTVSANTNVEQRTGYVCVSGWTHTVTQDGVGGTISPTSRNCEWTGGSATINVTAQNNMVWQARPNVNWINVSPTSGSGSGSVIYRVAPYNEVATRQGTLTVAGNTFTVFQYGRRIKLDSYCVTNNYETHVIPITVNALAITQWSVTPQASWISVVDAGNGQGGDLVTIAIAENPSYKARTGTVKIGTETFTVTQQGRPTAALSFSVSPTASTASVEGANGLIAVTATPDLPWTATSGANWLTIYTATATGTGNGNVVYVVSPNPTLSQRTGTITVTPEAASGMAAKTHKVTQPAATAALSSNGYQFEASGEPYTVTVSCADIVQWTIVESLDWITVNGSTSRTGPGTVTLQAAANNTVYPRSGTVKIAGKTFSVSQKARGVELEYDTKLFGTDGGYESISIHPDGNVSWTAVASDATWITIFQGDSGTGDGEILYIVSPYVGNGTARTGWITVGDKKVYITQRAYDLSIQPNGAQVAGNNGAGEFGVSASIGDVWNAIVTEPWITLVSGYDSGTGSGTVRFIYTENTTGKTRTGKIIVSGEVYTLEQRARQMVTIAATAEHGGHVSGGGTYDLGTQVTLTATPDSGYKFSHWTGSATSMQNPLTFTVETAKSYNAVFEPLPIAFTSVVSSEDGVSLAWNNLAWAGTYRIYRGSTSVPSSATVLVELQNSGNCTYLDATGDVDVEYWYWIEAEGPSDEVMSDPMTGKKKKPIVFSPITYENLKGATNPNPSTYEEGKALVFTAPGEITGYTFAGWTPTQITASMTGAQTVRANWTAKSYIITFNANGGSGDTTVTKTYGSTLGTLPTPTRTGYAFDGWFTSASGGAQISSSTTVTGAVTYYAHWTANSYTVTFNANGGSGDTTVTKTYDSSLGTLPTPARTGYTFNGWFTSASGGTQISSSTMVTGAVTYYAHWTANSYTVTFNANGGSGTTAQLSCTYGQNATLTANGFTRTGHAFVGWMTSANGTTVAYTDGQSVLNLTNQANATVNLYAKWTDKWYVDAMGDDANQGDSTAQAFKTIQHAIDKSVAGMTVLVADGTYAPINSNNKAITIQSANGAASTIIDGGYPAETNRCVHAGGLANLTNTVIRGFTIQNGSTFGRTSGNNGAGVAGGTLYNCVVRSNHGSGLGGGVIYSTMYDCIISDNDTQNKGGGAHSARLMNCLLANNSCVNHGAGAYGGVLIDCMVISNRADRLGGGVCDATLTNCVIRDNVALTHGGGAYGGNMYSCVVTNNIAYQSGGGAYNVTFYESEIIANESTQNGGGAYYCNLYNCILANNVSSSSSGGAHRGQLENCLVYGNRANGKGGGIVNAIARNCTIYGNSCGISGGGAYADLENGLSIGTNYNCIVYGNSSAVDPEIDVSIPSFNCYTNDPHFIRAEAGDFRLRYNSPCINAGNNAYVTNTVDFAGNPRIVGETVDIGAYEYSASDDTNFTVQVVNGTGGTIYYEGDTVPIVANTAPTGYSFKEWTGTAADVALVASKTSASTTFKMPGRAVMLTATYKANSYIIAYNANGGSGTMDATPATYDSEVIVSANGFTREGCSFTGWATNEVDEVVYVAGQAVTNLIAQSGGVVTLYAVWESDAVEPPVITPADGATFSTETCTVTITCATPGAVIYYSSNGRTPTATDRYLYSGPFTISDTATITAFAVKGDIQSDYVDVTITHIMPEPLTLKGVLDEEKLGAVTTGDEVEWTPIEDAAAKVGGSCAVSGTITDDDYVEHTTWLKTKVSGKGTLSFWWRVDCEPDPRGRFTYDYGKITIDGAMVDRKDGVTGWMNYSTTFDEEGEHEIVWTYVSDGYPAEDGDYAGCMWVDGVSWSGEAVAVDPIPEIEGDEDVAGALSGSTDGRLMEYIKTAAEYNAYRDWVDAKGLDHKTVKESPRAWLSYALDAEGLIEREFIKGDVFIDSFKSVGGGSYALEVVVEGVKIGANAKAENLLKIFIVEGSASLAGTFSSDGVTASLGVTADGKLSVVATPKSSASGSFFIRVCMQLVGEEEAGNEPGGEPVLTSSTVTFDVNGGILEAESAARAVENGTAVGTLPSPTREGYVFDGWWTDASGGTQVTAETTVTDDVTYYAHWIRIYTVAYMSGTNGGGTQQTVTKTHDVVLMLKGATFVRSGYVQKGWATIDGGTKAYDLGASYTANASITLYPFWETTDTHNKVQLWEDGPYWAETNIGAEEPWEYGYYFWWGDTVGYKREGDVWVASDGSSGNFSFYSNITPTYRKDISTLQNEGWIITDNVLSPEHDAAQIQWGVGWRMPTEQEYDDMNNKCDWTWTTMNGVYGYVIRGRGDYSSASIFLPCAGCGYGASLRKSGSDGYYWSSVPLFSGSGLLRFSSGEHSTERSSLRYYGQTIRPVQGFTKKRTK